jgi:hypothetical protein
MFAFAKNLVKSAETIINPDADQRQFESNSSPAPSHGFRVIYVAQTSPASEVGIESLFDYIIGLNGHELAMPVSYYSDNKDDSVLPTALPESTPIESFLAEIENCRGRSVSLIVWSAKGRVQRTVMLEVPQAREGQDRSGSEDGLPIGFGMTVQWTPLSVADHVWHVLNVSPNSPAEQAGLISHADYIVGAENGLLASGGESLLGRVVSRFAEDDGRQDEGLELYVYNHDYDILRPVRIKPSANWGGSGLLGCGVGYGLLHRLPVVVAKSRMVSSSTLPPGGTLFEANEDQEKHEYIVPAAALANAAVPHITQDQTPPRTNRRKHHHHHAISTAVPQDLKDYFAEEEQRSRELEGRTNQKTDDNVPPPPKK